MQSTMKAAAESGLSNAISPFLALHKMKLMKKAQKHWLLMAAMQ